MEFFFPFGRNGFRPINRPEKRKKKKWAGDAEWRAGVGVFRPANSTFQNFSSLQRNKKGMSEGTKHQSSVMDPMSQKKRGENKQAAAVASGAIAVAGPQWK